VTRIALGGALLLAAEDRIRVYEVMRGLLKSVSVDPARMRDLTYQVNWPVDSVQGVPLNRLTTWAAIVFRGVMSLATEPAAGQNALLFERHYVQFTFDMNTTAEIRRELSSEESAGLFTELFRLTRENMSQGELLPS
jgi:hypothetical protein